METGSGNRAAKGQGSRIRGATNAQVGDWIEAYLDKHRRFTVDRTTDGAIHQVVATADPSSMLMLVHPLPRRLIWRIYQVTDGVEVETTVEYSTWHRALVISSALLSVISFWAAWIPVVLDMESMLWGSAASFAVFIVSISGTWHLARAGGHEAALQLSWDSPDRQGYAMEPLGLARRAGSFIHLRRFIVFLAAAIVVPGTLFAAMHTAFKASDWPLLALLCLLIGFVSIILLVARAVSRNKGMQLRFTVALAGIGTCIPLCFLVAAQAPVWNFGGFSSSDLQAAFLAQELLAASDANALTISGPKGSIPRSDLARAVGTVRVVMSLMLLGIVLIVAIGAFFVVLLFRRVESLLANSEILHYSAGRDVIRIAASGFGFLGHFRWLMVSIWIMLGVGLWTGIIGLGCLGISAIFDVDLAGSSGAIDSTVRALELALGLSPGSFWAELAVRTALAAGATGMLLFVGWSVGEYALRKYRAVQAIRRGDTGDQIAVDGTRLSDIVDELSRVVQFRRAPLVSVYESEEPNARVIETGLFRRRAMIEVSNRLLRSLNGPELKAVFAHELAHHVLHHCLRHEIVQVLARLTCMGGAFAGAVEDSYGSERKADWTAVHRFGANADALRSSLTKLHVLAMAHRAAEGTESFGTGIGLRPEGRKGHKEKRLRGSRRRKLRCWLHIYTADTGLAYWHPSIDDRIRALQHA